MLKRTLISLTGVMALLAMAASACIDVACDDTIFISGNLGIPASERVFIMVEVCREGICNSGQLDSGGPDPAPQGVSRNLSGTADVVCTLGPSGHSWAFSVHYRDLANDGAFDDGDEVFVRVVDVPSDTTLIELRTPVSYEMRRSGGAVKGAECKFCNIDVSVGSR